MGGIPTALAISRWQERRAQRIVEARRRAEAARTKTLVVTVLLEELEQNARTVQDWKRSITSRELVRTGFATERWQVLKATGAFTRVDDIELLCLFADCYQYYDHLNALADRLVAAISLQGTAERAGSPAFDVAQRLMTALLEIIEHEVEPKHALLRTKLTAR
ncbi:MAG: hypothetical protein JWM53_105 [bacterium]|nr:hypothetical protein [bacterium]